MKKTVSMLLAVLVAAIAVCTFATSAFAAPEGITDPSDGRLETTTVAPTAAPTTAAPTTAAPTTAAPTTAAPTTAAPTTEASTTEAGTTSTTKWTDTGAVVTRPEGATVIDEGTTKATTTNKVTTTKKPAANISTIPNTGSSVAAPAIALLALAAGTVAVVKTKKDN